MQLFLPMRRLPVEVLFGYREKQKERVGLAIRKALKTGKPLNTGATW
jgi:hypothetical protein